jgi:flagellar hook-associated protein 2
VNAGAAKGLAMINISNALGAGSGIDTIALVDQLADATRAPREAALRNRENLNQARISAIASTRSAINTFADALGDLFEGDGYAPAPVSGNGGVAAASLIPGARPNSGSMTLSVTQLARTQTWRSATFASVQSAIGQGSLTLTGASGTAAIQIEPASNSVGGLAAAINAAQVGVTARIITDADGTRLILTGVEGAAGGFSLTADSGASPELQASIAGMVQTQSGADALVTVDGTALRFTTNRIDNLLPGVRLDLASTGTTTVTVPEPERGMADLLGEFVTAYNTLRTALNAATAPGLEGASGGPLAGDSRIRATMRSLSSLTITPFGTNPGLSRLADLGIRTERDGTLSFNRSRFDDAYEASPDAVRALLDPENPGLANPGVAGLLDSMRDMLVAEGGPLDTAGDAYAAVGKRLIRERERLDDDDARLRAQLQTQFTAMERQVSLLNSTRTVLDQQIAAWNAQDDR